MWEESVAWAAVGSISTLMINASTIWESVFVLVITLRYVDCICLHVIPDQVSIPLYFIHSQSWNTIHSSWSTTLQFQKSNRWRWISSHRVKIKQQHLSFISWAFLIHLMSVKISGWPWETKQGPQFSILLLITSRPCTICILASFAFIWWVYCKKVIYQERSQYACHCIVQHFHIGEQSWFGHPHHYCA